MNGIPAERKYGNAQNVKLPIGIKKMSKPQIFENTYYSKNKEKLKFQSKERYRKNKGSHTKNVKNWNKNYPWFKTWMNAKQRCDYPKDKRYKDYGGKGIKCLLSLEDVKFLWTRDKAHLMKQASIDRIDNNGNYELDNCRFVEMEFNRTNRQYQKTDYIRTTTQIPTALYEQLRAIAFSRRKSIAFLIREALEAWVKNNKK